MFNNSHPSCGHSTKMAIYLPCAKSLNALKKYSHLYVTYRTVECTYKRLSPPFSSFQNQPTQNDPLIKSPPNIYAPLVGQARKKEKKKRYKNRMLSTSRL
ncbi:Uncharacterized protein APZ42_013876 [Daphnia magna]|uniref:Uncharacterized protein n=1 Tax=Daphnia magna TaxID=35525 RepID=A0A162QF25_9CRUS|nr:Uncharacterized protein APZ42_013876 [Daphnia magna]